MAARLCFVCNRPLRDAVGRIIMKPTLRDYHGTEVPMHHGCAGAFDRDQAASRVTAQVAEQPATVHKPYDPTERAALTGFPDQA